MKESDSAAGVLSSFRARVLAHFRIDQELADCVRDAYAIPVSGPFLGGQ